MVDSMIYDMAEKFPKLKLQELLDKKVLPRINSFIDKALKNEISINDLAKLGGY